MTEDEFIREYNWLVGLYEKQAARTAAIQRGEGGQGIPGKADIAVHAHAGRAEGVRGV